MNQTLRSSAIYRCKPLKENSNAKAGQTASNHTVIQFKAKFGISLPSPKPLKQGTIHYYGWKRQALCQTTPQIGHANTLGEGSTQPRGKLPVVPKMPSATRLTGPLVITIGNRLILRTGQSGVIQSPTASLNQARRIHAPSATTDGYLASLLQLMRSKLLLW